jgi:hypothetical protein
MNKENLIKNGKFYNVENSTLIAKSSWFTHYETQRRVIYQTAKGIFFEVKEVADTFSKGGHCYVHLNNGSHDTSGSIDRSPNREDLKIREVVIVDELTSEQLRKKFEYTMQGGVYQMSDYAKAGYTFAKTYEELFSVEEA